MHNRELEQIVGVKSENKSIQDRADDLCEEQRQMHELSQEIQGENAIGATDETHNDGLQIE
jgi:hypothetical protein